MNTMANPRSPTWDDLNRGSGFKSRQDWTLKWWMALAVILTFVFHGVMVWTFENVDMGLSTQGPPQRTLPDRLTLSKEVLQNQEAIRDIPQDLAPVEKPSLEKFKPEVDDFEKASMLPENQELDLTPNVKEIQNLVRATNPNQTAGDSLAQSTKALAGMLAAPTVEGPSQADIATAMNAVKSSVLSKRLSSKQMVLEASPVAKGDAKMTAELLESLGDGQSQTAASTRVKGFSSLEDVLAGGGKVGGSTGPILMPTDLLFEFGSDEIAEKARLSMMKLGFLIQKNANSVFTIEGHTDTIGTDEANLELSGRRARSVVQWLVNSLGISDANIRPVGMGETEPLENADGTKEEQSKNRRVVIKVRK
jgi:outer membrane protein OmpA-like peptidoglycan-associated protein